MRGKDDVRDGPETQAAELMDKVRILAKRRIIEAGIGQGAFARRAGVSPATVSLWLRGESNLEPETLTKVCGAVRSLRPHAATASVLHEAETLAATG